MLSEIAAGAYGLNYQHFAGGDYRRNTGGDLFFTFRNNVQYHFNGDYSVFEGSHDHTNTFEVRAPWNDPYRNWRANYTWGQIEGADYRSFAIGSAYRPTNKFQLTLTSQFVKFNGDQKQLILGGNYDLGNDRAISGRVVQSNSNLNAYVALQRSGGAGIEYFLILGDPNALKFRRSLILKVTYPLQMFLGHHGS